MWTLTVKTVKTVRRRFKMSGVSREAPCGVQLLQRLTGKLCPRLRINRLRCYQCSVLVLTYITYMTYHLTRKPISVVKGVLHQNCSAFTPPPGVDPHDDTWCDWPPFNTSDANTLLGVLDSAFLFSYAGAMFVSGMVAERVDLRYFLSLGMLFSAIFCYLFGLARTYNIHHVSYYIFVQIGAGISQTSGWPGTVAIVGKWFGNAKKGLIFGIWNSHTSLGNILGTLIAAEYVDSDWAMSFILPALVMGVVAGVVWVTLVPEPAHVGLNLVPTTTRTDNASDEEGEEHATDSDETQVIVGDQSANLRSSRQSTNSDVTPPVTEHTALLSRHSPASPSPSPGAVTLSRALSIPGVVQYSMSLFFAKLVSYTFLYWLPVYIKSSTSLSARDAGELSTVFDAGGVLGAVLAGELADRAAAPALVCLAFYAAAAPALLAYQIWGATSYWLNCVLLILTGILVNGPYALITTAVSADLGTKAQGSKALATVTAIIDGTGSLGAALGPLLAGLVSAVSWAAVFYMLIVCDLLALVLLLRTGISELHKLRQERRIASPPRVRIE